MEKYESEQLQNTEIPEYSVIITCYYEEQSIEEFHGKLSVALDKLDRTCEIIMVNDGSTDKTFESLKRIYDKDPKVTVIADLFRNAGQLSAMTAGITLATGKHFVFMDSDLQLEPDELSILIKEFEDGYDIISGCRKDRKDNIYRKLASKITNVIVKKISHHNITDFGCTFKVYDGRIIRAFEFGPHKQFQTAHVYSKAQTLKEIPITHHARKYGKSGWTFRKLFAFHMDNFVGISRRPFQILSVICLFFAFLFFIRLIIAWILPFSILNEVTPGLMLNMIVFSLLVSVTILSAVGEYVIRSYIYLQKHPLYIIRRVFRKQS
jgi:glycosyltransferase involved in cell wall biosynthesis